MQAFARCSFPPDEKVCDRREPNDHRQCRGHRGKGKETELRSTVFKRSPDTSYILKTQKARQFISEVNERFPALPFTLRAIEDEQVARVGVSEARRHELLEEYPVLHEKSGEIVAQFKFTLLLLPGGTKKVTGLPLG